MIVRPLDKTSTDLELFRRCFERNGTSRTNEALEWQYRDNPTRELFVNVAYDEPSARFAAIYASLPVFARIDGQKRLALQSLDTLTDRDFRGKGLFVQLAQQTFDAARSSGAAFIYGFPNGNSAPGFFGKLGWSSLDPMPFLVRPLRTRYVLAKVPRLGAFARRLPDIPLVYGEPRVGAVKIDQFDERVTRLWSEFARGIGFAVERDAAYMNWRLRAKPDGDYSILGVLDQNELVAMVAFVVREKHGGRIGYVMECMWRTGAEDVGRKLLLLAVSRMAAQQADAVLAWCFAHSPNYRAFLRAAFVPLPKRLRPIELHVGVRPFDNSLQPQIIERRNWYMSYLDSDTV
jgi:GNAT superfamily N-acetyltransferase